MQVATLDPRKGTPSRRRPLRLLLALPVLLAIGLAWYAGRQSVESTPPSFHRLTFRRGYIPAARFSPDGGTVVYGAEWDGSAIQLYSARMETPESRTLGVHNANILAMSRAGEMAISLSSQIIGPGATGTLARTPLGGGTPREILEGVDYADFGPGDNDIAVARSVGGKYRLEYPIGKILYETPGSVSQPRVSPDGSLIAFIDHPLAGDFSGSVAVVDMAGKKRILSADWGSAFGLAWAPGGKEIWFTAYDRGDNPGLRGVTLSGRQRLIARVAGWLTLHDISRDGDALLTRDGFFSGIMALTPSCAPGVERDLYWLDYSIASDLSEDGSLMLFKEGGEAGGRDWTVYVRKTDGSPAVRLGEGFALALSPDRKWAMVSPYGSPAQLVAFPIGAGETRVLTRDRIHHVGGRWLPDGKRIVFAGSEPGHGVRYYVQDAPATAPRAITPEGVRFGRGDPIVVSPDGQRVAVSTDDGKVALYPVGGGEPQIVPGLTAEDKPIQWSADGGSLFVQFTSGFPAQIFRVELPGGKSTPWKELMTADRAGLLDIGPILMTPGGKWYAYSYTRTLSDLYFVQGLK